MQSIIKNKKKLRFAILLLMIFYFLLSTSAILDLYLSIKFQIESENELILCLIFLTIFPLSLLIQSFFIFCDLKEDSNYDYQKINEAIEIINADKIFEMDFRYLTEDLNRGIIIIILSSILSYSKLIVFHIFINAYRSTSKFGFFLSLKLTLAKITALQILFQTIPFCIRKFIFDVSSLNEKNEQITIDKFLNEYYYMNFVAFISVFFVYFMFYKFYFSRLEKDLLRSSNVDLKGNYCTDTDNNSILSLDFKPADTESLKRSTFTLNNSILRGNNSAGKGKYNVTESVDIRNSF